MLSHKLGAALVLAISSVGFSGTASAIEATHTDFASMFRIQMVDKNKDGMVSKKEFMAMMDKAYDMQAKSMGAKGGKLSEAQVMGFLKSLYTGG